MGRTSAEDLSKRWNQWIKGLKNCDHITIPRYVADNGINVFIIHGFADASKLAICAAIYVSVKNSDGTASQNLLVSKSRIAPKDTSIPRLELFAAHMLAKLTWVNGCGTMSPPKRTQVILVPEGYLLLNLMNFGTKTNWLINEEFWPNQQEITQTKEAVAEIIPKQTEKTLLATANEVNTEQQEWTTGFYKSTAIGNCVGLLLGRNDSQTTVVLSINFVDRYQQRK
eukprot:gene20996-23048_t